MTPLAITLTNAGQAAIVNAQGGGTNAVVIAQLGLSGSAFVAAPTLTALPGEFKRIGPVAGQGVDALTIHLTAQDVSADAYTVRGFGLLLADGTLLGTYAQDEPIFQKAGVSVFLLAFDIKLAAGVAAVINMGATNFAYPPASDTRKGVAEIATVAEVQAGTDPDRIVTPLGARSVYVPLEQRAAPGGVATLDAGGKIPSAQLPAIAITDCFPVASLGEMLNLVAQRGDLAVRTDLGRSYMLRVEPANILANWLEVLSPIAPVQSVNGKVGAVALGPADVGAAPVSRQLVAAGLVRGGGDQNADRTVDVVRATAADIAAGTSDDVAVTPLALASLPKSLTQNGYDAVPGKRVEQWGRFSAIANGSTNVTFPIAFPGECFAVVASGVTSGGADPVGNPPAVVAASITPAGFTVFSSDDTAAVCTFIAVGR